MLGIIISLSFPFGFWYARLNGSGNNASNSKSLPSFTPPHPVIIIGPISVVAIWLATLAARRTSTPIEIEGLLFVLSVIVTATGVAVAIIFNGALQQRERLIDIHTNLKRDLLEKQELIDTFRHLCHRASRCNTIWGELDINYDHRKPRDTMLPSKHPFPYAAWFFCVLSSLGEDAHDEFHSSSELKQIYSPSQLDLLANDINELWYGLSDSGKRRGLEKYLLKFYGRKELIWDDEGARVLVNAFFKSPFDYDYRSLDFWENCSASAWRICQETLQIHKQLQSISSQNRLRPFLTSLSVLIPTGLLFPLFLLVVAPHSSVSFFAKLAYIDIAAFFIAIFLFIRSIFSLLTQDHYKRLMEDYLSISAYSPNLSEKSETKN